MKTGYGYNVSYYKKVEGLGWMFENFRTTRDALRVHLRMLKQQRKDGVVRVITLQKI